MQRSNEFPHRALQEQLQTEVMPTECPMFIPQAFVFSLKGDARTDFNLEDFGLSPQQASLPI